MSAHIHSHKKDMLLNPAGGNPGDCPESGKQPVTPTASSATLAESTKQLSAVKIPPRDHNPSTFTFSPQAFSFHPKSATPAEHRPESARQPSPSTDTTLASIENNEITAETPEEKEAASRHQCDQGAVQIFKSTKRVSFPWGSCGDDDAAKSKCLEKIALGEMMKPKKAGSRKPVSKEYMERNILAHRDDLFVNAQAVIRCSTLAEEEYENMYGIRARDLVKFNCRNIELLNAIRWIQTQTPFPYKDSHLEYVRTCLIESDYRPSSEDVITVINVLNRVDPWRRCYGNFGKDWYCDDINVYAPDNETVSASSEMPDGTGQYLGAAGWEGIGKHQRGEYNTDEQSQTLVGDEELSTAGLSTQKASSREGTGGGERGERDVVKTGSQF